MSQAARRTHRFAIGVADGRSSNSWVVTTSPAGDVYIICRDNFNELKASLHHSGNWRFGQTEKAAAERPDLVKPGSDRVWTKWDRPAECGSVPVVAFQIYFPAEGLYLGEEDRVGWKKSVRFVEASADAGMMDVINICIVPERESGAWRADSGTTVAVLDLDGASRVHIVATREPSITYGDALSGFADAVARLDATPAIAEQHPAAVVLAHGTSGQHARFLMPLPLHGLLARVDAAE